MRDSVFEKRQMHRKWLPGDGLLYFTVAFLASIAVMLSGASDRWLAAVVCTGVPFLGTITYFRPSWKLKAFWGTLGVLFIAHLFLVWLVFGVLLRERNDVGLVTCVPGICLECLVVYLIVDSRTRNGNGSTADDQLMGSRKK